MRADVTFGRQYALGELPLLLDERTRRSVAFIGRQSSKGQFYPVGTVVFVGMQYAPMELVNEPFNQHFRYHEQIYAVTAKHLLTGVQQVIVRLRTKSGKPQDIPTRPGDWKCHLTEDVAVLPWNEPNSYHRHIAGDSEMADDEWIRLADIDIGTHLFFVGLFTTAEDTSGTDRWSPSQPIARFATLALGLGERVPVKEHGKTVWRDAYLVEAHSWGGMSGAPCYAYTEEGHDRVVWAPLDYDANRRDPLPGLGRLLGLVAGHFNVRGPVEVTAGRSSREATAAVNSGIAVVTPAKYITQLLMDPKFVKQRQDRLKREAANVADAAVPDAAELPDDETLTRDGFMRDLRKIKKEPRRDPT